MARGLVNPVAQFHDQGLRSFPFSCPAVFGCQLAFRLALLLVAKIGASLPDMTMSSLTDSLFLFICQENGSPKPPSSSLVEIASHIHAQSSGWQEGWEHRDGLGPVTSHPEAGLSGALNKHRALQGRRRGWGAGWCLMRGTSLAPQASQGLWAQALEASFSLGTILEGRSTLKVQNPTCGFLL